MTLSIGIRELRQNASKYLRLVEERGEPIEITDRGRPMAQLSPLPDGIADRAARGERQAAACNADRRPTSAAPLEPRPGVPLPSEILEDLRADER